MAYTPATKYVDVTGDTMTGNLQFTDASIQMKDSAVANRNIEWQVANKLRWTIGKNNAAESGGNAGTNLSVSGWDDAGNWLNNALVITRASGLITVLGDPTDLLGVATKQYTDGHIKSQPTQPATTSYAQVWVDESDIVDDSTTFASTNYVDANFLNVNPSNGIGYVYGDLYAQRPIGGGSSWAGALSHDAGAYLFSWAESQNYSGWQIGRNNGLRWFWICTGTESGSNTGSHLYLRRYEDDSATFKDFLALDRTDNRLTHNGKLVVRDYYGATGAGDVLQLLAGPNNDHVYIEFFARSSAQSTRSGWVGFGGVAGNDITMRNEISGGHVGLEATGTGRVCSASTSTGTTATAANLNINTATPYQIQRSTSSQKVKTKIRGLDGTFPSIVEHKRRSKAKTSKISAHDVLKVTPVEFVSTIETDDPKIRVGAIAEDIGEHFPPALAPGGDSIEWPAVTAALLQVVKDQQKTIADLEARVSALEARV